MTWREYFPKDFEFLEHEACVFYFILNLTFNNFEIVHET